VACQSPFSARLWHDVGESGAIVHKMAHMS
jgi:hypothetical protein